MFRSEWYEKGEEWVFVPGQKRDARIGSGFLYWFDIIGNYVFGIAGTTNGEMDLLHARIRFHEKTFGGSASEVNFERYDNGIAGKIETRLKRELWSAGLIPHLPRTHQKWTETIAPQNRDEFQRLYRQAVLLETP